MIRTILLSAVSLAVVSVAGAQTSGAGTEALAVQQGGVGGANRPVGVSLRAGAFLPTNSATRDIGTTFLAFGADYRITDLNLRSANPNYRGGISLSIDYYGKNNATNIPILVNYVGTFGAGTYAANELFYEAGIGVAFTRFPGESKTRFGYQVGLGYQFGSTSATPVFLEAKFMGTDDSKLDGFGLFAGIRF